MHLRFLLTTGNQSIARTMAALHAADFTDVLVCGAGPVGLLTALGLAQQGVKTLVIGKFVFCIEPFRL